MPEAPRKPLPIATPETQPFWDGLKQHELRLQRCPACGNKAYFYPRPFCPTCFSWDVEWFTATGKAKLHTYEIVHRAPAAFRDMAPYVLAVVELEEGPRMMTNLVDIEPDPSQLPIDMPLEIVYDDVSESVTLPKFRPATASSSKS
ncbi:MAG: Zn-ribbon domain-containing OB-fold protein [Dehalococcoidia bacterium]